MSPAAPGSNRNASLAPGTRVNLDPEISTAPLRSREPLFPEYHRRTAPLARGWIECGICADASHAPAGTGVPEATVHASPSDDRAVRMRTTPSDPVAANAIRNPT